MSEERRDLKSKGERERYTQLNAEFARNARSEEKAFSMNSAKKQRKTTEWKDYRSRLENWIYQRNIS